MKKGFLEFGEKASEAELGKVLPQLPSNLPKYYIDFLKKHNGAIGDLPVQPYYFQLWKIDEIVINNKGYEIHEYLPNYFGIGGNGGGELIALQMQSQKIFTIPFIPMEEQNALLLAESFEEFEKIMGFTNEVE